MRREAFFFDRCAQDWSPNKVTYLIAIQGYRTIGRHDYKDIGRVSYSSVYCIVVILFEQ